MSFKNQKSHLKSKVCCEEIVAVSSTEEKSGFLQSDQWFLNCGSTMCACQWAS